MFSGTEHAVIVETCRTGTKNALKRTKPSARRPAEVIELNVC